MITREMIRLGLEGGLVKLIVDPNMESGTVCQIGDNWFYFGGATAEEIGPYEYRRCIPTEDIVNEIFETLVSFHVDEGLCDEYRYYDAFLTEHLLCNREHDKGSGEGERGASTDSAEEQSEVCKVNETEKAWYNLRWRNAFIRWVAWEKSVICFYLGEKRICACFADLIYDATNDTHAAKMIVDRLVAIRFAFELETKGSASVECQKYVADILCNPYEWFPRLVTGMGNDSLKNEKKRESGKKYVQG